MMKNKIWEIVGYVLGGISLAIGLLILFVPINNVSYIITGAAFMVVGLAVACLAYVSHTDMGSFGIEDFTLTQSSEEENVYYLNIGGGARFIFRDGKFDGWYMCGEKDEGETDE